MKLVEDYGLDGLDVDYEYPQNDAQARGYVSLLRELRAALDQHARHKHADFHFLLTVSVITASRKCIPSDGWQIAAPCGPDNYHKLHIREMVPLLDFWNLMTYDFCQFFIGSDPFFYG